ncbi:MAG: YbjQ family protein [Gammaproteobacteria bacterium]|nr:MAG: YbjQ family protein [Gammaproteobacteria bacterium]|tara:strand:- start:164 stop:484 length:321 start_codon:yes stop_codon:yes gene_type:complete
MLITSTFDIADKTIVKTLGLVKGNTIRARHVGRDIMAGLRGIVGGELHEYTKLLAESREQALDRMIEDAEKLGADAVVGVSFSTSVMSQGAAELMAFGTAVLIEDN